MPTPNPASACARATTVTRLGRLAAAALLAIAATLGAASPALAHDELVGYDVLVTETTGAVEGFSLSFSNEILEVGTEIIATGPAGDDVREGGPAVAGRVVTQALTAPLDEGVTAIAWRVVSSDGHPISGVLELTVAPDGTGTLQQATAPAAQQPETDTAADDTPASLPVWVAAAAAAAGAAVLVIILIGARRRAQTLGGDGQQPGAPSATDSH